MKKQELNELYQTIVKLHDLLKEPNNSVDEKLKLKKEFLSASNKLKEIAKKYKK